MQFLSSYNPSGKKVLLRLDLDLPQNKGEFDTTRMEDGFGTVQYLWENHAASVTVIAHRGHHATPCPEYSLEPIRELFYKTIIDQSILSGVTAEELRSWITVKENLRFDAREEEASTVFGQELAAGHDLFVNDAFATSHRKHTSIVVLPTLLPTVIGLQFEKELSALTKITTSPARPYVFVLGGAKLETKLPLLEKIAPIVDTILLGGKIAVEAKAQGFSHPKVMIAEMTEDTFDICAETAAHFSRIIHEAKTVVWNGPMGMFEDPAQREGTRIIAEAIANNTDAYTFLGGGDTEAAVTIFGIDEGRFHHVSSGGGAMMYYLTYGTLPALEVL